MQFSEKKKELQYKVNMFNFEAKHGNVKIKTLKNRFYKRNKFFFSLKWLVLHFM